MRYLVLILPIALAACQKTVSEMSYEEIRALAAEISERCEKAGAGRSTPEFKTCYEIEANREFVTRENNQMRLRMAGAAMAAGAAAAGRNMANHTAVPTHRSATCRTIRGPDGSYTTVCN